MYIGLENNIPQQTDGFILIPSKYCIRTESSQKYEEKDENPEIQTKLKKIQGFK